MKPISVSAWLARTHSCTRVETKRVVNSCALRCICIRVCMFTVARVLPPAARVACWRTRRRVEAGRRQAPIKHRGAAVRSPRGRVRVAVEPQARMKGCCCCTAARERCKRPNRAQGRQKQRFGFEQNPAAVVNSCERVTRERKRTARVPACLLGCLVAPKQQLERANVQC